jgi:hypothetical protein
MTLEWLQEQIDGAERHIEHVAAGGTGPNWDALRNVYGLGASHLPAGVAVPTSERCDLLSALKRYAEYQLSCLQLTPEEVLEVPSFRERIAALGQPPRAAEAKRGGLMGGIFANAGAARNWEDGGGGSHQLALRCPKCGARQEKALDFRCRYCGASMAGSQA